MKPKHSLRNLIFAGSALMSISYAHAAPYNWTGATTGAWNTGANWSGTTVPLITDDLTILGPLNSAGPLTIDFDADNSAKSLIFTNTAATSITNTTSGSLKTLTLGSGGITTGAGAVQIGANVAGQGVNITLGAAQTWNIGAGGLTVTNIIGGLGTGITKTGAGNLTLNGPNANTFTGGLNVNGGTLTLDFVNRATPTNLIAATNALQINNAALTITGRDAAAATTAQTFAGTTLGAGRNTINIAKGALATSATLNLGALTANSGSVTIFSPTTAWTSAASTTEIVNISAGGNVSIPGSGTAFANAGIFHRVAGGAVGSLRLAAVNTGTGQLLLKANAGNLAIGTGVDPSGSYQLAAGSIALTGPSTSVYGLLLNATGAGTNITVPNSGTLTLNSVIQTKATESVNIISGTGVSNVVIGAERNLVLAMDNAAGLSISAPIANNGSTGGVGGSASAVTIFGSAPTGTPGAVTFSGANTYSGATNIINGALVLGNLSALQNTSGISMSAGSFLQPNVASFVTAAPITLSGTGNVSMRSGVAAGSTTTFNGAIGGTTGNLVFTTQTNSFSNALTTYTLGAASNYTGNTLITTGNGANNPVTVRNGVADALPVTTVLTFAQVDGGGTGRDFTYNLNGNNQTLAGLDNGGLVPQVRRMTVTSTAAAELTINNTADYTFGGSTISTSVGTIGTTTRAQITGAIALTKSGTGTFTLGGTLGGGATAGGNSFTGATKILGGILVLGESLSIQNSAFDTTSIIGGASDGLRAGIGGTGVTTLTLGGLTGGNDFSTRFTSTTGGYTNLTNLTLNPGTGATPSYSGDVGNGNGSMTLTKTGLGTQTLAGSNTYTGNTTLTAGTINLGAAENANVSGPLGKQLANAAGTIILNGGTLQYSAANQFDYSGRFSTAASQAYNVDTNGQTVTWATALTSSGGTLAKSGTGTLILSNSGSSHSGNVTIAAGTVQLGVNNGISTASGIDIGSGAPTTATLDLNGFDQTLSTLVFTTADAGGNLTVTGGANSKLTINATANTELGAGGVVSAARDVTVDMSGLGELDWNGAANTFRVGLRVGATNSAGPGTFTTTLADKNTITALALSVGDVAASNSGGTSVLRLGQTNFLNANTINLGNGSRTNATLEFRSGLTAPKVTIRGTDGIAPVGTWEVGRVTHTGNVTWTALADFSAGELDASVTNLRIGVANTGGSTNRAGTENATFTMGKGTLAVTSLIVGQYNSATGGTVSATGNFVGDGTFNLNDATGIVTAGSVILADNIGTATGGLSRVTNGTFNLTAGTLEANTIDKGADTGNATATTRNFNFTGGTVRNIAGSDLAIANVPINLTGSGTRVFEASAGRIINVASTSDISGIGQGFTKGGNGTMAISGTKSYTGATLVSAGSLVINGNISTSILTTVASGATLGGTGTVGAATISGILAPGNSIGTITAAGDVTWNANNSWVFELGTAAASLALADSGGSTQDLLSITGGSGSFLKGTGTSFTFDFANGGELGYYKLVDWAGTTGFADGDFLATNLASGLTGTFTVDGGTSALYLNVSAIPEPSSALLLGALGAMMLLRRRR